MVLNVYIMIVKSWSAKSMLHYKKKFLECMCGIL